MTRRRRRAARRGWGVVAGAFLVLLVGFGTIYSYAAFADDIAAAFGASMVSVSFIFGLSAGACFLVGAVSGPLADRVGPRVPAVVGMLLVGLGLTVAASATSLAEVYAGFGLLTGLGTGFAYVPAMAAVQRWFSAHRGLASGIAASGIGVGMLVVPSVANALLASGGWRLAFLVLGVLAAMVGVVGALMLEPRSRLIRPESAAETRRGVPGGLAAAIRSPGFGLVYLGTLLVSLPAMLPHAMLVSTARDLGVPREEALALLGLIGFGTVAGRFLLAALADVVGRRATFLACCGAMAGSMAVWASAEGMVVLQVFALVFGALQGGFVALLPAFGADSFGTRAAGTVLGLLYTSRGIALFMAPTALAAAMGAFAGHSPAVAGVAVLGLAGTLLLARAPRGPACAESRPWLAGAGNEEGPGGFPPEPSHRVAGCAVREIPVTRGAQTPAVIRDAGATARMER